jgi:hypothetical protein
MRIFVTVAVLTLAVVSSATQFPDAPTAETAADGDAAKDQAIVPG